MAGLTVISLAGLIVYPSHTLLAGPGESDIVKYLMSLDPDVTVLARPMSTFPSGQGDVVRTLHPRVVHNVSNLAQAKGPVYFLRDHPPTTPDISPAMRYLQPRQIQAMEEFCEQAEGENGRLEESLSGRSVRVERISDNLDVWTWEGQ